jgi:hypothetical protein
MRFLILTAALGLMMWSMPEFRAWSTTLLEDSTDPHAVAAIELRCASKEVAAFRNDCANELRRDFELGVREPETIVRLHCTQFSSDWARAQRTPPSICTEIYGGWIKA